MNKTPLFSILFALTACTGSSDDKPVDSGETHDTSQDSGDTEDTAQDTSDTLTLSEGVWVGTYSLLENQCGADPSAGDLELTVSNIDGDTFTLALEPLEYSCSMDGPTATCDPVVYEENSGNNVSVLSTANTGFTLESPTTLSGATLIEYSCVGAGCEDAIGEPEGVFCTIDVPFEATLSE